MSADQFGVVAIVVLLSFIMLNWITIKPLWKSRA